MTLTIIPGDGGHVPPSVTPPSACDLLAHYNALTTEQRAAFHAAIAPAHYILYSESPVSGAAAAQPGDTSWDADDSGSLWTCIAPDATRPSSWQNLLGGQALSAPDSTPPRPPLVAGGRLPGEAMPGRLMSAWNDLSPTQRAAFRLAIKPAFSNAANQAARLALASQKPGDWCRQADGGIYRLRVLPATTDGNWDLILPFP